MSPVWPGGVDCALIFLAGPYLHYVDVSKLNVCAQAARKDTENFGIACTKTVPEYQEVIIEYPSDIARLKQEAAAAAAVKYGEEGVANADFFVFANATLLTFDTGKLSSDILYDAVLVTRGGEIEAIVGAHDAVIPYGATVLDVQGGECFLMITSIGSI